MVEKINKIKYLEFSSPIFQGEIERKEETSAAERYVEKSQEPLATLVRGSRLLKYAAEFALPQLGVYSGFCSIIQEHKISEESLQESLWWGATLLPIVGGFLSVTDGLRRGSRFDVGAGVVGIGLDLLGVGMAVRAARQGLRSFHFLEYFLKESMRMFNPLELARPLKMFRSVDFREMEPYPLMALAGLKQGRKSKISMDQLVEALEATGGNRREAARRLGVHRKTVSYHVNRGSDPRLAKFRTMKGKRGSKPKISMDKLVEELEATGGNRTEAAKRLGVSLSTVNKHVKRGSDPRLKKFREVNGQGGLKPKISMDKLVEELEATGGNQTEAAKRLRVSQRTVNKHVNRGSDPRLKKFHTKNGGKRLAVDYIRVNGELVKIRR